MNTGGGQAFSREMGGDEVGILLRLDKHKSLVLWIAALQDLSQLLSFIKLGDLMELLHHVSAGASDHANGHEQVALGEELLRGRFYQ